MKRMLNVLRPKIETQFKSWGSCIPEGGKTAPGEHLSEVTVMLRTKFRGYLQAVVEKLAENTKLQNSTKLKKILQDSKETMGESDIRGRMQMLKELLRSTINHLHTVFETQVFIAICRWYWDRMAQDVLGFLESRKENRSWYKGSQIAVSILDDTFASQMQQLVGNALPAKDLEPPRSILERMLTTRPLFVQITMSYWHTHTSEQIKTLAKVEKKWKMKVATNIRSSQ
ncbi:hypothetical protein J1N35_013850 [Gossypium stocksii]|uniref:Uncharacterized protein n=1 Tax=Gossypium stocksii TaxID=47602 RepID=A0A9D3VVW2_9ROSI|nr:hypothetical protein J1N35_013850 [Gossypium stocksii]